MNTETKLQTLYKLIYCKNIETVSRESEINIAKNLVEYFKALSDIDRDQKKV